MNATPERTEELEAKLQAKIGQGPEAYSPRDWVSLREGHRLALLYPDRYVAFRDHHDGRGDRRRLACREVVYVGDSQEEVQKYLSTLSDKELLNVFLEYVPGPRRGPRQR